MKKILLLFLPVILSCSMVDHDVKIVVENNSNKTVENIRFSTTNDKEWVWFDALEPSESVSKELNVKNYNADGNYTFEYITDDGKLIKKKGNYLEEGLEDAGIVFKILNGGVEIEEKSNTI